MSNHKHVIQSSDASHVMNTHKKDPGIKTKPSEGSEPSEGCILDLDRILDMDKYSMSG